MHGFYTNKGSESSEGYILCSIELEDNQMSAQRLYYWGDDEEEGFEFLPYREYFIRPHVRNDPIVKFKMILSGADFMFGISLRRSGKVDLYYNFAFVNESEGKDPLIL